MNELTLKLLLVEATNNYKKAAKLFRKYDNHDDMEQMDMWHETVEWLKAKLADIEEDK